MRLGEDGYMRIEINPNAKKIFLPSTVFCIVLTVFLIGYAGYTSFQYRSYVTVDAVITDAFRAKERTRDVNAKNYNCVQYTYTYNGKEYTSKRTEFTLLGKNTGKHVKIKCSPENPEKLQNIYGQRGKLIAIVLLICMDAFLIVGLKKIHTK